MFEEDRRNRYAGKPPAMIPVVSENPAGPAALPTPLLLVVALCDHLTVADHALEAYERVLMPKRLAMLDGGHFDAYEADFERSAGAAVDWFQDHLRR